MRTTSPRFSRAARWLGLGLLGGTLLAVPVHAQRTASLATPPQASAAAPLVFRGVTVIDVQAGRHLPNHTVVVVGSRIRALGRAGTVPVPKGARVVDARGKYLIPGLWDMHIHPTAAESEASFHETQAIYDQFIANGVTGVRDAGAGFALATLGQWKRDIAAGRRVGPRMIVSGPAINDCSVDDNNSAPRCEGLSGFTYVSSPEDARRRVDSLKAAGADMIKTYTLSLPNYFAIAAEARRLGIPFGGHFARQFMDPQPDTVSGLVASDSGVRILDHLPWVTGACGYDKDTVAMSLTRCTAVAEHLRRNNTWVTYLWWMGWPSQLPFGPGLTASFMTRATNYGGPSGHGGVDWTPPTAAERRQVLSGAELIAAYGDTATRSMACQQVRLMYAADLPLMPGTDVPITAPGDGVHLALLRSAVCRVPPLWLLQTATLNPARALGATDSLGTVAVGKVADLVLLEGDPLEDIWNVSKIAAVVANGRYFDRAALDQLLVQARAEWRTAAKMNGGPAPKHP